MPPFRGGPVNPELPPGCYDERYKVTRLPEMVIADFQSLDEHVPLKKQDFEDLFSDRPERVDLAMVGLGDAEVALLAPFLDNKVPQPKAGAKYCRSLYLHKNDISDKGADELVQALEGNNTLTELYLHYNRLGDTGAAHISRLLQNNKRLRRLDIGANGIGEPGIREVIDGLQDNGTIESIGLFGNLPEIQDDLAEVMTRLKPEARLQRKIGIQVKNKFRDRITEKIDVTKLPRDWEKEVWELISDDISDFFSNTDGSARVTSARRLLQVPRLEKATCGSHMPTGVGTCTLAASAAHRLCWCLRWHQEGATITLKDEDGYDVEPPARVSRDNPTVYFRLLRGDMAKTEDSHPLLLEYEDPASKDVLAGTLAEREPEKRDLICNHMTSIVQYLDPVVMFPSKPRFRGREYERQAGRQFICCAGPKEDGQGKCPYRTRYGNQRGDEFSYTLRRQDNGRFYLQGYGKCLEVREGEAARAAGGGGRGGGADGARAGGAAFIPKMVVREDKVESVFVAEPSPSGSGYVADALDDQQVPFQMGLSQEACDVLTDGGVNAMHFRALPPHHQYVPWRIAHHEHKPEDVAEAWAEAFIQSNHFTAMQSPDQDFSPLNVVDPGKVAKLLVGVDPRTPDANVRFVCEKCYDSYLPTEKPPPRGEGKEKGKQASGADVSKLLSLIR